MVQDELFLAIFLPENFTVEVHGIVFLILLVVSLALTDKPSIQAFLIPFRCKLTEKDARVGLYPCTSHRIKWCLFLHLIFCNIKFI